jgi:hypothetical protein
MPTKAELIGQIEAIESELTGSGAEYVKADKTGTHPELEKELERLESLISDSDDSSSSTDEKALSQEEQDEEEASDDPVLSQSDIREVRINKGVNIQIRLDGEVTILKSEHKYELPADRAKYIVAEKKGLYVDGI